MTFFAFLLLAAAFVVEPWRSRKRENIAIGLALIACLLVLLAYPEPR